MTTQPQRLHHLLDRLLRGVLLPEEAEQLAELVRELERRADVSDAVAAGNLRHVKQLIPAVQQAEAAIARVRQAVDAGPVGSCCAHLIRGALNPPTT
ncbi:hypothetical protein ACIPVA_03625 [Streptomyces anulatus]